MKSREYELINGTVDAVLIFQPPRDVALFSDHRMPAKGWVQILTEFQGVAQRQASAPDSLSSIKSHRKISQEPTPGTFRRADQKFTSRSPPFRPGSL
jgi:hypothetical protein